MSGPHQHPGEWRSGDWQPPSEQTHHGTFPPASGPPGGPVSGPPGYPQPAYGQPYGQPQQPYRQQPPPPGYPQQYGGPPPARRGKNNQTWLVGGMVVAVVVVLLLVLGIVVIRSAMGDDVKYQAGDNLCEAFKPDSFGDFDLEPAENAPQPEKATRGKVEERQCSVTYQGSDDGRGYASLTAKAEVNPTARRAQEEYESWAKYEGRTKQPGREVRDVTGFGQAASLVVVRSRSSLTLELHGYDDNLELSLRFYSGEPEDLSSRDIDKLRDQLIELGRQIMAKFQVPAE